MTPSTETRIAIVAMALLYLALMVGWMYAVLTAPEPPSRDEMGPMEQSHYRAAPWPAKGIWRQGR
jgi:hypothetical protein